MTRPNTAESESAKRSDLLLRMYDQMFNDINRHIMVSWQAIGVVAGAFALIALANKGELPIDLAFSIIVLLSGWMLVQIQDASYWYNRNLVIIANIEKQFLRQNDLFDIHYYFGDHREDNKMISHLRAHRVLGLGIAAIVIGYHFLIRVVPGLDAPWSNFEPLRCLPYAVAAAIAWWVYRDSSHADTKYAEFIKNSPGATVDTTGIEYGAGHGRSS